MKNYLKKTALIGILTLAGGVYSGGNFGRENNENFKYATEIYHKMENSRLEEILKREKENIFNQRVDEQSSDRIKTPKYTLPTNYCSGYANKAAKKLFKKEYKNGDAWDLKYENKIVYKFKNNEIVNDSTIYESLKNKIIDGTLKPGMLLVTRRDMKPKEYLRYSSNHKKAGKDEKGNKIEDTHVILYIGLNKDKKPEFIHKWVNATERITIDNFKDRKNLKPTLILDAPDKSSI